MDNFDASDYIKAILWVIGWVGIIVTVIHFIIKFW